MSFIFLVSILMMIVSCNAVFPGWNRIRSGKLAKLLNKFSPGHHAPPQKTKPTFLQTDFITFEIIICTYGRNSEQCNERIYQHRGDNRNNNISRTSLENFVNVEARWEGIVESILKEEVSSTEPLRDDERIIQIRKDQVDVPVLLLNLKWGKDGNRVGIMPGTNDYVFCNVLIVALSRKSKSSNYNRSELLVILKNVTAGDLLNLMPKADDTGVEGSTVMADDTDGICSRIFDEVSTSGVAYITSTSNVENTSNSVHISDEPTSDITHVDNPQLKRIDSEGRGKAIMYQ